MRIVSFLPSATEIVYRLGLGESLVGVTHECDFPPDAREKPAVIRTTLDGRISDERGIDQALGAKMEKGREIYAIDFELLEALKPDLFLTQALCNVCAITHSDVLHAASLLVPKPDVLSLNPHCLEDVFQDILKVGKATGREQTAEQEVVSLRGRVLQVCTSIPRAKVRPKVVCLEWLAPMMVAGHWVPEMVRIAGGIDPLGQEEKPSVRVEWRDVLATAPDYIFLMPCGIKVAEIVKERSLLSALRGWNEIPAVKEGHVYALDGPSYFNRSGPRLVEGLEIMASILHPGAFSADCFAGSFQRVNDF